MRSNAYASLIQRASKQLSKADIPDAVREARLLMLLASKLTPAELIARENDAADPHYIAAFESALQMRLKRRPLAHIAGQTEFYGLALKTDTRALIPRADSEIVVDLALGLLAAGAARHIADLGAGTGALLAAILAQRPLATGVAVEASPEAVLLARENLDLHEMTGRADIFQGSWSDWSGWSRCDLIISNPPYIRSDIIPELAPEVRDHDPIEALDGGPDGLDAYREIIAIAATAMTSGAHLVFEIGYDQKQAISALLVEAGFVDLQHKQDLGGQDRAIAARKT
ncbi:MAG: peptide chain release factor N(5)-glutamine methyltransferase [Pseudomonadota bacterium]